MANYNDTTSTVEVIDDEIIIDDNATSSIRGALKLSGRYIKYRRVIVDCAWHGQTEFFVPTEDEEFDMLAIAEGGKIINFVLPMLAFGRNIGKLMISRIGEIGNEWVRHTHTDDPNRYLYISGGYGKDVGRGGDAAIEEISRVSGNVVRMYARHQTLEPDEEYVEVVG